MTGEGLGVVRSLLTPGTTAVLLGASGTGKSTLVNALLGSERQKTNDVRACDLRGRHTTVTRALLPLPGGAFLIDTPGIRVAGLWDGTGDSFADVDSLAANCRFADCGHDSEPGCAVRAELDPERIAAWRKLQRELAWVTDRRAAAREREPAPQGDHALPAEPRTVIAPLPLALLVAVEAAAAAPTKLRAGVINARGRVYRPRGSRQRFSQATPSRSRSLPLLRR